MIVDRNQLSHRLAPLGDYDLRTPPLHFIQKSQALRFELTSRNS